MNRRRELYSVGDDESYFTIQSIVKCCFLLFALDHWGEKVFSLVHMEPSGASFQSPAITTDPTHVPSNPFINAGALVLCSLKTSAKLVFRDRAHGPKIGLVATITMVKLAAKQPFFAHDSKNFLMIDPITTVAKFKDNPTLSVTTAISGHNLADQPHKRIFWRVFFRNPIKVRTLWQLGNLQQKFEGVGLP